MCINRCTPWLSGKTCLSGDRGGNEIQMQGGGNLHGLWDDRLAAIQREGFVAVKMRQEENDTN
jgi:hypothetical protein